jgi:aspartate/methionine/tyrosine aminotransferase
MPATVSSSTQAVAPSRIRELAEIAMTMEGVQKLYFGESNLPTPEFLKQAAAEAMAAGFTTYTSNAGLLSTREALAEYYAKHHGVTLDPAREIIVTSSGVQALNLSIGCLLDPGDEALILTPAWPNACSIVAMNQARAIEMAQPLAGDRYAIDFDALEAAVTPRTRFLMYTSPSNPLGWVATREDQLRLLEFTRKHGLWLLADEVYERLTYGSANPEPSILRLASRQDAVLVAQSFSKSYCMTGWRLGWLVGRADLIAKATQMNEFIVSCAPAFVQKAGEVALRDGEPFIQELLTMLRGNRDYCAQELRRIPGVTVPEPDGAFYLFPKIDGLADSFEFCKRLLLETKVGLAPGVAFGNGGEGSVRICYAVERPILETALGSFRNFVVAR